MTEVTVPMLLDSTGQEMVSALKGVIDAVNNTEATQQAVAAVQTEGESAVQAVELARDIALENIGTGIDSTLSISGQAADAAAVGNALAGKAGKDEIPDVLPNPNALTFTGAVTGRYDGSNPLEINIPNEVDCDTTLTQSGKAADAKAVGDELTEVKKALADLSYEEIQITTFTNNVGTAEIGSAVTAVTLSWATNKTPSSLTLDGTSIDTSLTSQTLTGQSITADKTFTLSATDEREAIMSKTTSITFLNGVYWGASTAVSTFDSAFILGLTKGLQSSRAKTFTVNAGADQYIYYACPYHYGTASFNAGGFDGGFSLAGTVSFTNASGYTENYDVYKSDNANLGNTTVKVT